MSALGNGQGFSADEPVGAVEPDWGPSPAELLAAADAADAVAQGLRSDAAARVVQSEQTPSGDVIRLTKVTS